MQDSGRFKSRGSFDSFADRRCECRFLSQIYVCRKLTVFVFLSMLLFGDCFILKHTAMLQPYMALFMLLILL